MESKFQMEGQDFNIMNLPNFFMNREETKNFNKFISNRQDTLDKEFPFTHNNMKFLEGAEMPALEKEVEKKE